MDAAPLLLDGHDRDRENVAHAWAGQPGCAVTCRWDHTVNVAGARLVFDSDLNNDKRMAHVYPQSASRRAVPAALVKRFRLEAQDSAGRWSVVHREDNNRQRLVRVPLNVATTGLRLVPEAAWGGSDEAVRVFAFEPVEPGAFHDKIPAVPDGPHFSAVRARVAPQDLAPPDNGLEAGTSSSGRVSA
jgi:hypothetical protein